MQVIPVIDLMGGRVVHARKGQRESYQPIKTSLCNGSSPHEVIDAFLGLHDFDTLYIADLDALMGKGVQREMLERLQQDYPDRQFWVDRGLPALPEMPRPGLNGIPVIGSESLTEKNLRILPSLRCEFILSLDFMGKSLLGARSILEISGSWPEKVIIMSLSHVGANQGPDLPRLKKFRALFPEKFLVAAGGVGNADDLKRLDGLGMNGALIASALHSGALGTTELRNYV